jgi:uncharacterized protein YecE (DUF72 family)
VLWRITHGERHLVHDATDPATHRLIGMHRAVKRAAHKMKAFLRFKEVIQADAARAYVAWFEPAHHVVERVAPFFARRFASMRWSILTPECSAHWDGVDVRFGAGALRSCAPTADQPEELWRTYYANVFNPARVNTRAMRAEMPARYWSGLPEARLIPELRRGAPARVRAMLDQSRRSPERLPDDCAPTPEEMARAAALDHFGAWDPEHDPGASAARARDERVRASGVPTPCATVVGATTIAFGVAGWTDPTLTAPGVFYPGDCRSPEDRLRFYASRYPMVEVDATYYAMPTRAVAAAWATRTPESFVFDVKAHALMTGHPTDVKRLPDWLRRELPGRLVAERRVVSHLLPATLMSEVWSRFRSALDPLRARGKLGAIMLQFPRWFTPTRASAAALRRAKSLLGDDLATVEFRNAAWLEGRVAARTIALLRELRLSYVIVDAPQGMESSMPPTVAVTDPRLAVFRLHGRRVATWEAKNDPVTERYRYLYDRQQLSAWVPRVIDTAFNVARVHMTFNNNHANYATTNAAEMSELLESAAKGDGSP